MGPHNNKELIRKLFVEVLNGRDLPALDGLISRDYTDHNPVPGTPDGVEGIKAKLSAMLQTFPDLAFDLGDLVAENDLVAARYQWSGTQKGAFLGVPPTGEKVRVEGMDFYRIKGCRIVEHWDNVDTLSLLQQLGAAV